MSRVAVVYHSVGGSTQTLAQAAIKGIRSLAETEAVLVRIDAANIHRGRFREHSVMALLDSVDAIVFASPTFMGCVSAQFKAFMDATSERYTRRTWRGKLAAGITVGGSSSGDQLNTLQTLQVFACQHGMLWVSLDLPSGFDPQGRNRQGAQSGLVAQSLGSDVSEIDRRTAEYLGARVGDFARRLSSTVTATEERVVAPE